MNILHMDAYLYIYIYIYVYALCYYVSDMPLFVLRGKEN